MVMVFGEITTNAKVDYEAIVRKTCRDIGFTSEAVGLDADTCKVLHRFIAYLRERLAQCCPVGWLRHTRLPASSGNCRLN